jgi:hypothetical protein
LKERRSCLPRNDGIASGESMGRKPGGWDEADVGAARGDAPVGMHGRSAVATIFGAAIAAKDGPFSFHLGWLRWSILFICLAGVAGGVIASSSTQYQSYSQFWSSCIGPFRLKLLTAEVWSYLEHVSFWIAIVLAVLVVR